MGYTQGLDNTINRIDITSNSIPQISKNVEIGRVYAILLDEYNLSKDIFDKYDVGTIFYLDYSNREDLNRLKIIDLIKQNYFQVAKPLHFDKKLYPLVGEIVPIHELPSPITANSNNIHLKYYDNSINYSTGYVKYLQSFAKDHIIQGRSGNSIRFSETNVLDKNWWNDGINDKDPITIISNFTSGSLEDVNSNSSIILSSTQTIPISASKTELNALTQPSSIDAYKKSQVVLTADRVVSLAREDVVSGANNNLELFAKNIINLDADNRVTLAAPYIILGLDNSKLPTEPALLGNETVTLLLNLIKCLSEFSISLSKAISTTEGSPIVSITTASESLFKKLNKIIDSINNIISSKVYIAK